MQNLDIILTDNLTLGASLQPGTIKVKQLFIPEGYKLSGYSVTGRVQTSDITSSNYRNKNTPISYSVSPTGYLRVANIELIDADARSVDIIYRVTKL